jgi:thioredoxin-like negative regulator of GroEL
MYSLDVDVNREVAMSLGVRSVPTIKTFNMGEIVDTKVGLLNEEQIKNLVKELVNG